MPPVALLPHTCNTVLRHKASCTYSVLPRMHCRRLFFHKVKGRIFKQFNYLFILYHLCVSECCRKLRKTNKILQYRYKRRAWNGGKVSSLGVSDRNWGRVVGGHLAASFLSQFMPKAIKLLFCTVHDTFWLSEKKEKKHTVSLRNKSQSNRCLDICIKLACIFNECILANAMHVCTPIFYLPNTVLMLYIT